MEFSKHVVPVEKLESYIFNKHQLKGWPKGRFLLSLGFDNTDFETVKAALILHALNGKTIATITEYGTKWETDGLITSPTGQIAKIRTVWFSKLNTNPPQFVTFKPLRKTP